MLSDLGPFCDELVGIFLEIDFEETPWPTSISGSSTNNPGCKSSSGMLPPHSALTNHFLSASVNLWIGIVETPVW